MPQTTTHSTSASARASTGAARSRAEVQEFFDTMSEALTRGDGRSIATVEVRWPYLDARGNELGEEASTYTLRRDDGGELKLRVTVMHGAKTFGQPRAAS